MQVSVTTVKNIFEPYNHTTEMIDYTCLIDYLTVHYPDGFELPTTISVNAVRLDVIEYDYVFKKDDFVVIAFNPAGMAVTGYVIIDYLIGIAISTAISYVIGEIFAPDMPESLSTVNNVANKNPSSVYSLNSQQNRFNKGEVIPVIYGKVRLYPSLIEQSYYRFQNNEMFLYQMLCIGHGKYNINKLLIENSNEIDLAPDDLLYKQYTENDFATGYIKNDIGATFSDNNYHMRVNTLPEVSGLELRGTPETSEMLGKFSNDKLEFYEGINGEYPDISSLVVGSSITITGTYQNQNDGTYTITNVNQAGHYIQVDDTFILEPENNIISSTRGAVIDTQIFENADLAPVVIYWQAVIGKAYNIEVISHLDPQDILYARGMRVTSKYYNGDASYFTYTDRSFIGSQVGPTTLTEVAKFNAIFETSYGAYHLENDPTKLKNVEIDIEYPRGIYNSDSSGEFTPREVTLKYNLIGNVESGWLDLNDNGETWTEQEETNTPQRRSYLLPLPVGINNTQPLRIRLKRSSTETGDIKSQDMAVVTRIKSIYDEPNLSEYGDITILWTRIKASNAISSQGQFRVNTWVTRADVANDLKSVLTDVYSNTNYGAKLDANDLIIPNDAGAVVNGAIDTRLSVLETMQMIGKANRYQVFLNGSNVIAKKDALRPIRTALYNETNVIAGSFSMSYLFDDSDRVEDGIEMMYRDTDTFDLVPSLYPANALFAKRIELFGCTDPDIAADMARYTYQLAEARRNSITFETDIQGIIPAYMDRFGFGMSIPSLGSSGRVDSINGRIIGIECKINLVSRTFDCNQTFDCDEIFCQAEIHTKIVFIDPKGTPSKEYEFTVIDNYTIELTEDAPAFIYTGYDYDKTPFLMVDTVVSDYLVTSIKPLDGNKVQIEGINYSPDVYDLDYLLTDGADQPLTDAFDIDLVT